jgi:hypothetical protein
VAERAQHYVPRRVTTLAAELADLPSPGGGWAADDFHLFGRMVSSLYHVEFHGRARRLTDAWDDAAGAAADPGATAAAAAAAATVSGELVGLLDDANYVEVGPAELHRAMASESALPLRIEVEVDDYDALLVYRRGTRTETVPTATWRGLRTRLRTVTVDERVVVHTRVKPASSFAERGIDPAERNVVPGHMGLKQFRDVPRADLEMLLPSARVRMRPVDSVIVGVPAVASGIAVLVTKLLPTLGLMFVLVGAWLGLRDEQPRLDQGALVVLFGGLATLGAFLVRQWTKLKNRRLTYLKMLSESLYFRTVADGPGVLHALLDAAEQQETVEVLLAYRFLAAAGGPITTPELDAEVQRWLREAYHAEVDFQVDDALAKLRALGLLTGDESRLSVRPLPEALVRLDRRWDNVFGRRARTGTGAGGPA